MTLGDQMTLYMVTLDVTRARELWRKRFAHLAQPASDEAMLQLLHLARTQSNTLSQRLRFYSHRWLEDHELPSLLPDELKPAAERMYPRVVRSVGLSINAGSELTRPIVPHVREAMENAVLEVYADRQQDDIPLIKRRMLKARRWTVRKLLGIDHG